MVYGYGKKFKGSFFDVLELVKGSLAKEGFGVLTEIDVKKVLKNKLGVDYGDYVILGACNPPFAYEALKAEKEIGLLLPCNLIVYSEGEEIIVSAILPTLAMKMLENPLLADIAAKVEEKLNKVIDNIKSPA